MSDPVPKQPRQFATIANRPTNNNNQTRKSWRHERRRRQREKSNNDNNNNNNTADTNNFDFDNTDSLFHPYQQQQQPQPQQFSAKIRKMMKKWSQYSNGWDPVATTHIIPIRVPLVSSEFELKPFCADQLTKAQRKISWIIDLTNVTDGNMYYGPQDIPQGIKRIRIKCAGHDTAPTKAQTRQFCETIDRCMQKKPNDYILVHCTHGLNRTGFMICEYLLNRSSGSELSVQEAIRMFEVARKETITKRYVLGTLKQRHQSRWIEQSAVRRSAVGGVAVKDGAVPQEQKDEETAVAKEEAAMVIADVVEEEYKEQVEQVEQGEQEVETTIEEEQVEDDDNVNQQAVVAPEGEEEEQKTDATISVKLSKAQKRNQKKRLKKQQLLTTESVIIAAAVENKDPDPQRKISKSQKARLKKKQKKLNQQTNVASSK